MFRHVLMTVLMVVTAASVIAVQGEQIAFAETVQNCINFGFSAGFGEALPEW
jgi:hypothetical protein